MWLNFADSKEDSETAWAKLSSYKTISNPQSMVGINFSNILPV